MGFSYPLCFASLRTDPFPKVARGTTTLSWKHVARKKLNSLGNLHNIGKVNSVANLNNTLPIPKGLCLIHRPASGINSSSVTNCFLYKCDQILFSPWPVTGCPCLSVHTCEGPSCLEVMVYSHNCSSAKPVTACKPLADLSSVGINCFFLMERQFYCLTSAEPAASQSDSKYCHPVFPCISAQGFHLPSSAHFCCTTERINISPDFCRIKGYKLH